MLSIRGAKPFSGCKLPRFTSLEEIRGGGLMKGVNCWVLLIEAQGGKTIFRG